MNSKKEELPAYSRSEEIFNMSSHIIGDIMGIVEIILCIVLQNSGYGLLSGIIFGISLFILYAMSSTYHGLNPKDIKLKSLFRIFDHCSIFILIAGSYTTFHRKGVITYRTSEDLWNWSEDHILYAPWYMICPECPEMFKMGDWWYLCYSHFDQNAKTTYRISKSCHGPWRTPSLPGFDGRRFYAAKSLTDGKRRFQWGNIYEREGLNNEGKWTYAGDMAIPHELLQREDGSLAVCVPHEIVDSFHKPVAKEFSPVMGTWEQGEDFVRVESTATFSYGFFKEESRDALMFHAKLTLEDGYGAFGLLLKSTEGLSPSWELIFEPTRSRVSITRYPCALDPFWETLNPKVKDAPMEVDGPRTIERPIHIERGKEIDVKAFVDGSFVECFVNDELALSFRIYDPYGQPFHKFGLFVEDGTLEVTNIKLNEED